MDVGWAARVRPLHLVRRKPATSYLPSKQPPIFGSACMPAHLPAPPVPCVAHLQELRRVMESAAALRVPLPAKASVGERWGSMAAVA